MVGLLVTPTTCWSRRSASSPPVLSRPREISSSHTATPAAESSASRSVMTFSSVTGGGALDAHGAGDRCVGGGDHAIGGEAELFKQDRGRGGGTEVLDTHALAGRADQIPPRHRDAG